MSVSAIIMYLLVMLLSAFLCTLDSHLYYLYHHSKYCMPVLKDSLSHMSLSRPSCNVVLCHYYFNDKDGPQDQPSAVYI